MRPYAAHRLIEVYAEVASAAGLPVSMVSLWDRTIDPLVFRVNFLRSLVLPLLLASTVRRQPREHVVILREFLARPFVLGLPFLWSARRRLLLTCVHNVQRAQERRADRFVLRLLHATGFGLLVLESDAGLRELGIAPDSGRVLVLPLPLSTGVDAGRRPPRGGGDPIVGVIGHARAEKRFDALVARLEEAIREGKLGARILVGSPSRTIRASADRRGIEVIDTTERREYVRALRRCDVLALDHDARAYRYRTSGVIADAVAMGTAVVAPDFPVFRAQLNVPVPVGAVFASLSALPAAVAEALRISDTKPFPPEAYVMHRSPERIAESLRAYVARVCSRGGVPGRHHEV